MSKKKKEKKSTLDEIQDSIDDIAVQLEEPDNSLNLPMIEVRGKAKQEPSLMQTEGLPKDIESWREEPSEMKAKLLEERREPTPEELERERVMLLQEALRVEAEVKRRFEKEVAKRRKEAAKKITFAWRIILTEMESAGAFEGDVPEAFSAVIGQNGSLTMEPFALPEGVVYVPEDGGMELPAPLRAMLPPQMGTQSFHGQDEPARAPVAVQAQQQRPMPPAARGGIPGPPQGSRGMPRPPASVPHTVKQPAPATAGSTAGLRTVHSSGGNASVIKP